MCTSFTINIVRNHTRRSRVIIIWDPNCCCVVVVLLLLLLLLCCCCCCCVVVVLVVVVLVYYYYLWWLRGEGKYISTIFDFVWNKIKIQTIPCLRITKHFHHFCVLFHKVNLDLKEKNKIDNK